MLGIWRQRIDLLIRRTDTASYKERGSLISEDFQWTRQITWNISSATIIHITYSWILFSLWLHEDNSLKKSVFLPPNPTRKITQYTVLQNILQTGCSPWCNNPMKHNEISRDKIFHAAYVYSLVGHVHKSTIFQFLPGLVLYASNIIIWNKVSSTKVITMLSLDKYWKDKSKIIFQVFTNKKKMSSLFCLMLPLTFSESENYLCSPFFPILYSGRIFFPSGTLVLIFFFEVSSKDISLT